MHTMSGALNGSIESLRRFAQRNLGRSESSEPVIERGEASCTRCDGVGWLKTVSIDPADVKLVQCDCLRRRVTERHAEHRKRVSNLSGIRHLTFAAFDATVAGVETGYQTARNFAANPTGWLVLHGPTGRGKTHLAAAVANELLDRGRSVVFQDVPTLLDSFRASIEPSAGSGNYHELFDAVKTADVLVLDDLGAEADSKWAQERLFRLLNHRNLERLPTVVTTNLRPHEFKNARVGSRLFQADLCAAVALSGAVDYRQRPISQRLRVVAGGKAVDQ